MNVYQIAPKLVRIKLDSQLNEEFTALNENLKWRPLSTNLDSCEQPPHLYFRITINNALSTGDYAGFPTGAPFILERETKPDKKTFFLRHWVRKSDTTSLQKLPLEPHPHMQIGAVGNRLVLRVDIDREVDKKNVFKSIPFATNMFQVVQIDAIIHEMPHVRLAFAIERTLSQEERTRFGEIVSMTVAPARKSSVTHHLQYPPVTQRPPGVTDGTTPTPASLSTMPQASSGMTGSTVQPVPAAAAGFGSTVGIKTLSQRGRPNLAFGATSQIRKRQLGMPPHASASLYMREQFLHGQSRQVAMQMRQPVPKRPMSAAPQNIRPAVRGNVKSKISAANANGSASSVGGKETGMNGQSSQHGKDARGNARNNSPVASVGKTAHIGMMNENAKANTHPDVRLWEDHDANDPYEPLFITEDVKFMEKANRVVLLDGEYNAGIHSDHPDLFGATTGDLGKLYDVDPYRYGNGDESDIEIEINRSSVKPPEETPGNVHSGPQDVYLKSIAATAEYNRRLGEEREDLREWLAQDADFQEQQNIDEDVGDADSGTD